MSYSLNTFAISPALVINRQEYYRIISSAFTHSGIFHIGMNMMAMMQLGPAVEKTFGSLVFLLITAWAIVLAGGLYVTSLWAMSDMFDEPSWMNVNAVGYSGILFTYSLVESFHAPELTRSLCGMISVPTKVYPLILLLVLSLVIPGISFMGHMCGLLVGALLITPLGPALFIPTAGRQLKSTNKK
jgi:membrane associated rhomboid family serine protease